MKTENLNLSSLKYFIDTVENQSLTKSAALNFVTRPAVSHAIQRLEDWSGKKLLTHKKNVFELTKGGQEFYRQMKPIYLSFKTAIESKATAAPTLNVGCSLSLADRFLIPSLKHFKNLAALSLKTGTTPELARALEDEHINLAIYIADQPIWSAAFAVLHKGRFVVTSPARGASHTIITTEPRPEVIELKQTNERNGKSAKTHYLEVESWTLALKLAKELKAACLVPDFLTKGMKTARSPGYHAKYHVYLSYRNPEHLSVQELKLIELLTRRTSARRAR